MITTDPYTEDAAWYAMNGFRETCETRRASCVECINRGKAAGVVK